MVMLAEYCNYTEFTEAELEAVRLVFWVERVVPVAGWPGYAISECGRIFSKVKYERESAQRILEMNPVFDHYGYRCLALSNPGRPATGFKVARLLAKAFLPPPKEGENIVRHLNDESWDDRLVNLAWGTKSDNERDKHRNYNKNGGKKKFRRFRYASDLTFEEVQEIRRLREVEMWPYDIIGKKFYINYMTTWYICDRRSRLDVPEVGEPQDGEVATG